MRVPAILLATTLILVPAAARAADLVVWWEAGFNSEEDAAVQALIATFERKTGRRVELTLQQQREVHDKAQAALEAGRPPDFLWGTLSTDWVHQWAYEDRLVDLTDALSPLLDLFDADVIEHSVLRNGRTGRRSLYALPVGRTSNYVHVWRSLLERAGFTPADIPKEWGAFWSFWCDQVQPAARRALGRGDVWGIGLPMSATNVDTRDQLVQFQLAYEAPWLGRDGRLQELADPAVRTGLIKALDAYTAIWRKGCTPPDALDWDSTDNNKAFLAQRVVMTPNVSLSIPSGLRRARPEDYQRNAATIDWPDGAGGRPLVHVGFVQRAVVFKAGGHAALAQDFVRLLVEDGWLAHWLTFAGDRFLPPMRRLLEQPFWLDPGDPHRMHAAVQAMTRPHQIILGTLREHEARLGRVWQENVWGRAVHRVAAEGVSPEQAVDEAIARIKQILSE
jgi:multiple sugar transport system substrate-binding protein